MSVTNKSPYVSFYVIFEQRKGSLHQTSVTTPEAAGLHTSRHSILIGTVAHKGVLYTHSHSPVAVIPVSANMWLVLASG